jgi:hypothetical protein
VGAHEVGLTATVLLPSDFALLLEARIGLTDLAEYVAGAALPDDALYAAQLRDVIQAIQPRARFQRKEYGQLVLSWRDASAQLWAPVRAHRRDRLLRAAFHCGDERLLVYRAVARAGERTSVRDIAGVGACERVSKRPSLKATTVRN